MENLIKSYVALAIIPVLAGMVYLKSHSLDLTSNSLATGQPVTNEIENLSSIKKMQPLSYIESPYGE